MCRHRTFTIASAGRSTLERGRLHLLGVHHEVEQSLVSSTSDHLTRRNIPKHRVVQFEPKTEDPHFGHESRESVGDPTRIVSDAAELAVRTAGKTLEASD
jgi:hypothetical protein